MRKKLPILILAGLSCAGCAGFGGGSGGGNKGLLFFRNNGAGPILHRMDAGGGAITDVVGTDTGFVGSMDENFAVYTSLASGNINRIVGGAGTELTTSGTDFRPCVTPDGSRIAFVSTRDGDTEIYTMDGTGAGETNVSNDAGFDGFATINRAGTKIVFVSSRDGNDEIYIVDVDGTNLTRLTTDAASDTTPAFSADGTQIIFSSDRTGGLFQIYRMDVNGANVTQITTSPLDKFHASFKVNGTAMFFYTNGAVRQIHRCNADGSGEVVLTSGAVGSDKMGTWVY